MPTVCESIDNFLHARRADHNAPELLDLWTPAMESQVNCVASGEPVDGKRNTWTDGQFTWHHIRIPRDADSEPNFRDYSLSWPLDPYVLAIGSTGWDWQARQSCWLGFDFDAIVGHAGVGLTSERLDEIRAAAFAWPFFEVRKSTGGAGLHLYVRLSDGFQTANHTEHAALARAVLALAAGQCGFDFSQSVDACGGNMWLWHRKMTPENGGLKLIKNAASRLAVNDLPSNWRDHVEVVSGRRSKIRVQGIETEEDEYRIGTAEQVPLDDEHRRHIDALSASGFTTAWLADRHLLQTHTVALKSLHRQQSLRGVFETLSQGGDPGTANCFCFPLKNGAWRIYRFGRNVEEAVTWTRGDWTWCYLNRQPDTDAAMRAAGGAKHPDKLEWTHTADTARVALATLELPDIFPAKWHKREVKLSDDGGRLLASAKRKQNEPPPAGWAASLREFKREVGPLVAGEASDSALEAHCRRLRGTAGEYAGWVILSDKGWENSNSQEARDVLVRAGTKKSEVGTAIASLAQSPWTIVNKPFQTEYPGNREWNRCAARLAFPPSPRHDEPTPHWDKILAHAGQALDDALPRHKWAAAAGIVTGGDYLRAWIAAMIREPFERLPYLFFWGPENSGKSIVREACETFLTRGIVQADDALAGAKGFNGELEGAILCYVEETHLGKSRSASNRIKNYVTAANFACNVKYREPFTTANTTHWMHCSNDPDACPIFPGDTRIVSLFVDSLPAGDEIPKMELLCRLREEGAAFLRSLHDLILPERIGRLRVPVVDTVEKEMIQDTHRDTVERFVTEQCRFASDLWTFKSDLYAAYRGFMEENDCSGQTLSNIEFGRRLFTLCGGRIKAGKHSLDDGSTTRKDCYFGIGVAQLTGM